MIKFFKTTLLCVLLTIVVLAAAIPALNFALKSEEVRNNLLDKLASSLDGTLQAESLTITLDKKSLNISSRALNGLLLKNTLKLTLPDATFRFSYRDLLRGSLFPDTFLADSASISYIPQSASTPPRPEKQLNWSREINTLLKNVLNNRSQINITDATLILASTTFSKLDIQTNQDNSSTVLNLKTDILYRESVIPLIINGKCRNSLTSCFSYDFDFKISSMPLNIIPASQDFFFSGGTVDFTGKLGSNGKKITVKGSAGVTDLDMSVGWTSEDGKIHQEKKYSIAYCALDLQGSLKGRKINISSLDLQADTFRLLGSFILDLDNITDPFMDLRLTSDEMDLSTLKMLLPDPLINDWTTQVIFPRLENGTAQITSFILKGTFDEIGRLDEAKYSHSLSWAGILKDIDTFYNDHKPLARVDSAHLSMDGDLLEIRELSGKSGKSTLTRGNVAISRLYDPVSTLTTDVQGSFSLAWLNKLVKAGLTGEDMQQIAGRVFSISGQVNGDVNLSLDLTAEDVTLTKLWGKGTVAPMNMILKDFVFPLNIKKASFDLAYPDNCFIKGKGFLGKSPFNCTLNLAGVDFKSEFKLNLETDLDDLKKIFSDNKIIQDLETCVETVPVKANIIMEKNSLISSGIIDFSKSVPDNNNPLCKQIFDDNNLLKAEYNINYTNKKLQVKKITLYAEDGTIQASGFYDTADKQSGIFKNIDIHAREFPIDSLSILIPEYKNLLSGFVNGDLKSAAFSLPTLWSSFTGSINLLGWHGSFANPKIKVNSMDLIAVIDHGLFEIKGTDIRMADFNQEYPLTIYADLQKKNLWSGTVRLHCDYLDLTTTPSLFREGKSILSDTLPIAKIRFIIGADHVRYGKIIFSPLLMLGRVTSDKIIISKGLLQLENDFVWLTGLEKKDKVVYQSYFTIQDKPVDTLMAMMGFDNNTITGSLYMKGKLTATVSSSDETFLKTVQGPIYAEIKDGTIESSSIFIKILELISLENIFEKKEILQWKNSYKFNLIEGRFDLNHGVFSTNSLIMDASAFDVFSEGYIDVVNDTIKMKIKLAPFDTFNKLFSSIPYLGYVLTGKSKSLFDYTLSVTGNIESPNVKYIPLAGTIESLTGYIQRLVSGREKVHKEINSQLKEDLARKNSFILLMNNELAPLK